MSFFAIIIFSFTVMIFGSVRAAGITCNATTHCPASYPCCSEFGYCGTNSFCLGGCDPIASHAVTSCKPNPVCKDAVYNFHDNSRISTNATLFNGNASEWDWVIQQGSISNTNFSGGELILTLTEANGGSRITSTRYVHYGTITATLKTGRWGGVVTAFIVMSDVRDEIDWEFPGSNTTHGQSNYYWQGYIPLNDSNGKVHSIPSDSYSNYHDYTIDWKPESLSFAIDGQTARTINRADTIDESGVSRFPNTPSRIQISLWPAGIITSAPGTIQWAGGMINWNDPDYVAAGHFQAFVKQVIVKCADPQTPNVDVTAYRYGPNTTSQTPLISFTNETTLLNNAFSKFRRRSGGVTLLVVFVMFLLRWLD